LIIRISSSQNEQKKHNSIINFDYKTLTVTIPNISGLALWILMIKEP